MALPPFLQCMSELVCRVDLKKSQSKNVTTNDLS